MRKALWIGVAAILLLVGGGAWWLFRSLDSVVASAIRSYGPQITGVSVKLGSVIILPSDGQADINGLELGNPKGFATKRALSVGHIGVKLNVASITQDVVLIKEVVIEQPDVTYEHALGGSNLDVIQRNVDAYVAKLLGTKAAGKNKGPGKKMVIDNLYIRGTMAQVSANGLQGKTVTVRVPDVHLRDIGKKSGGVTSSEVTKLVLAALIRNVAQSVAAMGLDGVTKGAATLGDKLKGFFK